MLGHLFETYGNINAVDLEINCEHMRRAWDTQQPVESLLNKIQDCTDYSEAGGVLIGHQQQINVRYAKILQQGTSLVHVADGTRKTPSRKLGPNSNHTSIKCKEIPLPQLVTTLPMPQLPITRIKWPNKPLEQQPTL
jgi:hypothetical protein